MDAIGGLKDGRRSPQSSCRRGSRSESETPKFTEFIWVRDSTPQQTSFCFSASRSGEFNSPPVYGLRRAKELFVYIMFTRHLPVPWPCYDLDILNIRENKIKISEEKPLSKEDWHTFIGGTLYSKFAPADLTDLSPILRMGRLRRRRGAMGPHLWRCAILCSLLRIPNFLSATSGSWLRRISSFLCVAEGVIRRSGGVIRTFIIFYSLYT
jgi:hypothetical protein